MAILIFLQFILLFLSNNCYSHKNPTKNLINNIILSNETISLSRSIAFVSIPLPGHLLPLCHLAEEFIHNNWNVTFITTDNGTKIIRNYFGDSYNSNITIVSTGIIGDNTMKQTMLEASSLDFISGSFLLKKWCNTLWKSYYDTMLKSLSVNKVSAIITDGSTIAPYDVAEALNIPLIINEPLGLPILSPYVLQPYDYIPSLLSNTGYKDLSFVHRFLFPIFRVIGEFAVNYQLDGVLNKERAEYNLSPISLMKKNQGKLILLNSVFGIEYPRPITPNIHLVGPLISHKRSLDIGNELKNWLNKEDGDIIYINMGTIARISDKIITSLIKALEEIHQIRNIKILWRLNKQEQKLLDRYLIRYNSIISISRFESWIPSVISVLENKHVKVTITHCGQNSVYESLSQIVPVLCIPIFADQQDLSFRIQDSGAGLYCDRYKVSKDCVFDNIIKLLQYPSFITNTKRIQSDINLAGGVERAYDLINHVINHNTTSFILDKKYSYISQTNIALDVLIVYIIILYGIFYLSRYYIKIIIGKFRVKKRKKRKPYRKRF